MLSKRRYKIAALALTSYLALGNVNEASAQQAPNETDIRPQRGREMGGLDMTLLSLGVSIAGIGAGLLADRAVRKLDEYHSSV